jgi:hypothetical protein
MPQLVYIGGYGRSGSTLLETLMAASPDVIACGETVGVLGKWKKARRCSCGRPSFECPIWGSLLASAKSCESLTHRDVDMALLKLVPRGQSIMVDSSKTAWREALSPFRLRRALQGDFQLVHLVRDPRAVCWSLARSEFRKANRKGDKARLLRVCLIVAAGWVTANFACGLFGWFYPMQYIRVRYEDLARSPQSVLKYLFQKLLPGKVIDFNIASGSDNRHQLFGNRARRTAIALADVREDDDWSNALPTGYGRLIEVLSGFLARRYGYVRSGP